MFSIAMPAFAPQRGGGGDSPTGPSDLSPAELAAQAAMPEQKGFFDKRAAR